MQIKTASQLTGISTQMIRYYEKLGLIKTTRYTNGYRDIDQANIDRLVMIKCYSNLGISLKTMASLMDNNDQPLLIQSLQESITNLEAIKESIDAKINFARFIHDILSHPADYENGILHDCPNQYLIPRPVKQSKEFISVLTSLNNSNVFYHYYFCYHYDNHSSQFDYSSHTTGIITYTDNHIEQYHYYIQQQQLCYYFLTTSPVNRYINEQEINKYQQIIESANYKIDGNCIIFEIYENNIEPLVIVQIPVKSK